MLRCVALVRTDVSETPIASIIGVTRTGELGLLAATSKFRRSVHLFIDTANVSSSQILVTLMMEALRSFET
jgi:hypothetical protein